MTKRVILFSILAFLAGNLSCGRKEGQDSRRNFPPVITSVNILPERPNKESELSLMIQSGDPEGDAIAYRYQWIKNDKEIFGENKNSLGGGSFKKGDLIRVKVTPSDGKTEGKPFLSPPVKIVNSSPVVQEVRIEPKVASVKDNLRVHVKSHDSDGDFVYYSYQWQKDGAVLTEEKGEVLEGGRFKKGEAITVTVTPDDREAQGTRRKSEPIIISNHPPLITSSPPTSTEGGTYVYQVKANDPDNDPILFALKSAPKGMEIEGKSGLIRWEIRKEDKGIHPVEIEVLDNDGGRGFQKYTLTVDLR